jgi:propionyl-CoA carboxylase alpha chain
VTADPGPVVPNPVLPNTVLTSVLVANRGEIARRVFRSCARLGLSTVAVYSDPDAGSPHVREAAAAVRLPGSAPADTYLRSDLLIEAALRAGADAVHPGYGFLSENAVFAGAVQAAGLTWIGPPPDAIAAMGSKVESKRIMAAAGVPVLAALDPPAVSAADLPVLIKASAGGGGRGMRIVRSLAELPAALEAAASEAASAFGDPAVFCEPYIDRGRHIEVQVLADAAGTVWTVGERECSIQRRHQKIIEEAPSPLVASLPGLRDRLMKSARLAVSAIGYVNAGTVEFLADESGRFWFLEMNTRLQVEHPVTECTTGLDLVALQLQIAAGRPLPPTPPPVRGHAIEARLYAEDPAAGWQPQSGTLRAFALAAPTPLVEFGVTAPAGDRVGAPAAPPVEFGVGAPAADVVPADGAPPLVRLDSGVVAGSEVGVFYDPMLAKVIAWAADRDQAAAVLARALANATIHGLTTNRDLLVRVLRHPAFAAGQTDTSFLEKHDLATLAAPLADGDAVAVSALAAALADAASRQRDARVLGGLPVGWRNVPSQLQRARFAGHDVGYRIDRSGLVVEGRDDIRLVSMSPSLVELEIGGVRRAFAVARYRDMVCVDSSLGPVTLVPEARFADPAAQVAAGSLLAPMPGTVVRVVGAVGDRVAAGQPLLWLEAMKMEHAIFAPVAGIVAELPVAAGQQVEVGSVLAVVKPEEDR